MQFLRFRDAVEPPRSVPVERVTSSRLRLCATQAALPSVASGSTRVELRGSKNWNQIGYSWGFLGGAMPSV